MICCSLHRKTLIMSHIAAL